jgi:hypothetical protein
MKAEDQFENRLKRQRLSSLPTEWRDEILEGALQASRSLRTNETVVSHASEHGLGLSLVRRVFSQLLWPSGKAWAGLAAIWVAIIGFVVIGGDSDEKRAASQPEVSSPLVQELLREQNRLFVELSGGTEQGEAITTRRDQRGPRSRCDVVWREV